MHHQRFPVCVPNFAKKKTRLPKGIVVAQGSHTVARLTTVNEQWIQDGTVSTVPLYKPWTDKAGKADQHIQVKRQDDRLFAQDCKDEIQSSEKYSQWKYFFLI